MEEFTVFADLSTEDQETIRDHLIWMKSSPRSFQKLLPVVERYIQGGSVQGVTIATVVDPYANKRETLYLPYKGMTDRGITRGRR